MGGAARAGGGAGTGGRGLAVSSLSTSAMVRVGDCRLLLDRGGFRGKGGRGRAREVIRCITSRALAEPQCAAIISNRGGV